MLTAEFFLEHVLLTCEVMNFSLNINIKVVNNWSADNCYIDATAALDVISLKLFFTHNIRLH